jgi:hypothetical protein
LAREPQPAGRMGLYDTGSRHAAHPFEGGGATPGHATSDHAAHASPAYPGPARGAVPGAYSPAVNTLVDEKDIYQANKAGMDAKWSGSDLLQRALARHRGEKVEDRAIKPELGAPTHTRPLASPEAVIAQAQAASAPAAHAAPGPAAAPAAPHSGPSERDVYLANQTASDERAQKDVWLQRALERYGKKK